MKYPADLEPYQQMTAYQFIEFFWMNSPRDRIKIAETVMRNNEQAHLCLVADHEGFKYDSGNMQRLVYDLLVENRNLFVENSRLRLAWRSARSRARRKEPKHHPFSK